MDLSILIVNWNTRDLLAQCLASIYAKPPTCNFEVIIFDNASSDNSLRVVEGQFPQVRLIKNSTNVGFATANNAAIQHSQGNYLILLNPDTIVKPNALQTLVEYMQNNPDVGMAGALLLNPDGTLQFSCHPMPTLVREMWRLAHLDRIYPLAEYRMTTWSRDEPRTVDTLMGACIIVPREVIDEIGAFDESFFMYSEEVDWCRRIQTSGRQLKWLPQAQVFHYGGQSTRLAATAMFLQLYRGKLQFFRKHNGRVAGWAYKIILFVASLARLLLMPFAWLVYPGRRDQQLTLAGRYGRLLLALPRL